MATQLTKISISLISLTVLPFLFFIRKTQIPHRSIIPQEEPASYCGSDQVWEELLQESPEIHRLQNELDEQAFRDFQNAPNRKNRSVADYTLPLVVHIIHQNGTENINDAQVLQGVQDLNDAFANVGYYNPATGTDTRVEFCLARRDPDGNATSGITRTISPLTEYNYSIDDVNMKNLSRWDPTRYINVWLVREICSNNGCGVAGYSYFPSAHGNTRDGIAQEARWFGSSQGSSGVQIHEMGHYLGVYHTFEGGCTNNDCLLDGDRVCDTPPDQSTVAVPCGGTANSCNTDVNPSDPNNPFATDQEDMYWNYMDYGDFDCYSAFTPGQVDRMHFFITGTRSSLLNSDACQDPCLSGINTLFTPSATSVNVGQTVIFTNASTNATTFSWDIDGNSLGTTPNVSYTFNAAGTFTITLMTTNADPNCSDTYSVEIQVTCPVDAYFTLSPQLAQPGDLISFVNSSTNATTYNWTVNTAPFSTLPTPTYTVLDPGLYNFCLLAGNGFCEEQYCEVVLVGPGQIECEETFLKTYGDPATNEEMRAMINVPDGSLIIGGQVGAEALLIGLSVEGQVLWQKSLDLTNRPDQIHDLILDSNGFLVGVGVAGSSTTGRTCFAFKYDWQNHTLIWNRTFSNPNLSSLGRVLEISSGNYAAVGQLANLTNGDGCNGLWIEMDQNDGSRVQYHDYQLGSCETFSAVDFANDQYYVTGRYNFAGGGTDKMRFGISALDLSGNPFWSRLYIENVSKNARMYSTDILVENDHLIVIGQGDRNGTSPTNVETLIFSTALDGTIEWAQSLQIPGVNTERMRKLFVVPDGYLITGSFINNGGDNQDIFLMKTDKQGNELWTKAFDVGQIDTGFDLTFQGGFIFLSGNVGQPGSSLTDALLAKLTLDGTTTEPCQYIRDLDIQQTSIASPYDGSHPLSVRNNNYSFADSGAPVQDTDLETEVYCTAPCMEICNNDIDDDGDGLIDEFDTDCECIVYDCDNNVFQDCPDCQAVPPLSSKWEIQTVWSTDFIDMTSTSNVVVGDIDGDCIPDVVGLTREANEILVVDGQTGAIKYQVPTYASDASNNGVIAIGDVDRNGATDVFFLSGDQFTNPVDKRHRLVRYEFDGSGLSERFVSAEEIGPYSDYDPLLGPRYDVLTINLADVNMDGRPEVIIGNEIYDAINGDFLTGGGAANSVGSQLAWVVNTNRGRLNSAPVVVDVLPDAFCSDCAGLELVAGNMVYSIALASGGGPFSGSMNVEVDMSNEFEDGFTSVADLNLDGVLDVITTEGDPINPHRYYVTAWNPAFGVVYDRISIQSQIGIGPGRTAIANLDDQTNDLEIAFHIDPFLSTYKFDPVSNKLSLLARINVNDGSRTSVSIFDFNGDGQNEILYRDENEMRILKGSDLSDLVLPTYSCGSSTNLEYPFVADVNADGQAEIIIMCDGQLQAIGNAENGKFWASARKVWNQFSYFNVNVNDDLTIPIQQQAHHLTGDSINFNTFLKQYSDPNFPVANATIEIDSVICKTGDSTELVFEICNTGDNILSSLTPIAVYQGNPTTSATATLLNVFPLEVNLLRDSCLTITYTFSFTGSGSVFLVVNDNGSLNPPFSLATDFPVTTIPECDYTNNLDSTLIDITNPVLDLGPDIAVCDNGTWWLNAGPGFKRYEWQDGSALQTYTAWEPGTYWVEVEDLCGNLLRDTVIITIMSNTIVTLPEDLVLCEGDSVTLNLTGFDTYQWWPDAALDCANCSSVKVKPIDSTLVVVVVSNPDGCYSTDSILITLEESVAVMEQSYLCDGDTIDLYGTPVWLPGTYSFTGNSINGCDSTHSTELLMADTYLTELDSLNLCEGDTTLVFGMPVWEEGVFDRTLTTIQGCDSIFRIFVSLIEELQSVDSVNICAGDTVIIFGEEVWSEGVYTESYNGSNNCDSTAFIFLLVDPLAIEESNAILCEGDTLEYFDLSITSAGVYEKTRPVLGACDSLYRLIVEEVNTIETDETRFLCPNDTIEVFGNMVWQAGTFEALFVSTLTTCDSIHTVIVEAMDIIEKMQLIQLCHGETIVVFGDTIDQPGIFENWIPGIVGCDTLHTTELQWWSEPTLDWETNPACVDQNFGSIDLFPSGDYPPFEISWDNDSLTGTNVENIPPGFYPLTLTDAQGCELSAQVELEAIPSPLLQLDDTLYLDLGQTGQINTTVFPSDSLEYEWSPGIGLSCINCAEPEVLAINDITYSLTVRNAAACEATGQISLRVKKDRNVYIPNAFSPNGDGVNDWLTVFADESVEEVLSLKIFDRWGEEIFSVAHFQPNQLDLGWDGTFNNRPMNPAVFVYVAEILFKDQVTDVLAGDLVLIR